MKKPFSCSLLLVWIYFVSCTSDSATRYETAPTAETVEAAAPAVAQISFSNFAQQLPALSLPFKATCAFTYPTLPAIDTAKVSSFLKPFERPYRQFRVNQNITAILALFPADETLPRLRTYNQTGEVIDEQDLKFNPCGEAPGFTHSEHYIIQKDFTITHLDSTARWQFDSLYNELPKTRKWTIIRRNFKISPSGDITESK